MRILLNEWQKQSCKLNQRECCRATRAGTGSKAGPLPGLRTVCALLERSQQHYSSRSGERIGLKVRQSQVLWQRYKQEGLAGMLTYPFEGTVGKLMSHYGTGELSARCYYARAAADC